MSSQSLRNRLLHDIAEMQTKPYPNISLKIGDDITTACLVLTVEGYGHIHMSIKFPDDYPLNPPKIRMDSNVNHPNVYGTYICSSILNTTEGYTSAYTLKSIAIQMLSFFSSDQVVQSGGITSIDLAQYKVDQSYLIDTYACTKCGFGSVKFISESLAAGDLAPSTTLAPVIEHADWPTPHESSSIFLGPSESGLTVPGRGPLLGRNARRRRAKQNAENRREADALAVLWSPATISGPPTLEGTESSSTSQVEMSTEQPVVPRNIVDMRLPTEVIVGVCDQLDTEDLMVFAQAWAQIPRVMKALDLIRTRELQCFCLKESYLTVKLGVGVHVNAQLKTPSIESEFDLLSDEGFGTHRIRRSTQGRPFEHWLPLPISRGHWLKVEAKASQALIRIGTSANIQNPTSGKVIFSFMNDIVVKLNQASAQSQHPLPYYTRYDSVQSSLTHASEKAIESYFHLFHLLICLASSDPSIVRNADAMLDSFISGKTSKESCPSLGHLLAASLITSKSLTEDNIKAIIKETIIRNVVWTLTSNPELAYFEPSMASEYRLHQSFQASKTSYRLLMFLNLFRRVAVGNPPKPLAQLRDEAFERHGAPPRGSAAGLAASIRKIHAVERFPDFLAAMGIKTLPSKEAFNTYLKKCIKESEDKGYSSMPLSQGEALTLRLAKESSVAVAVGVNPQALKVGRVGNVVLGRGLAGSRSFFPQPRGKSRGRGGERGGR